MFEHLNRLMCSCGHDGVLLVRTSEGGGTAPDVYRTEGHPMSTPAPTPTRLEIQITGIRKHVAKCITEIDGSECGVRSAAWDTPMQTNGWMREHAADTGHKLFEKRTEEPVSIFSRPAQMRAQ
ncbi:hypothetical protein [Streptomyces sp. WAC 06725]|uniref:hypothetical protein n=1 Tax=Streptomyces sp. WAC 06725 TaxID=2203209 RepID=UPI0021AD6F66|nr:hypothetical protein [Streptomyces sp. WAC 06725]